MAWDADVVDAWRFFLYGPSAEPPSPEKPVPGDKLERARSTLRDSVGSLRELAQEIRSRA
jgi:hypothetical protein